jgi:hypothetical protein
VRQACPHMHITRRAGSLAAGAAKAPRTTTRADGEHGSSVFALCTCTSSSRLSGSPRLMMHARTALKRGIELFLSRAV